MIPKRPTSRHIVVKMAKVKDKETILYEGREKNKLHTKETLKGFSDDFSSGTL